MIRHLAGGAALFLALHAPALAEDEVSEPPEAPLPAGAKGKVVGLKSIVTDLVYSSTVLKGDAAALGGKPGGLGGKPASLETRTEALEIKETETEIRIELSGDILFDFDKWNLRPEATPVLERVAEEIRKQKSAPMIRIDGHTDSKGNDDYNLKLSQKRADSVKDWLVRSRATGGVLFTKGLGETSPVAPNENSDGSDNPEGRQKNRRVTITIKKI